MSFQLKTTFILLLNIVLLYFENCNATTNNPVVQTPLGRVKGSLMTSRLGKTIYAFRGIKYAKKPERFKLSEPITPWNGIFDASEEGPSCYQHENSTAANMSEDCLALNIYTNKLLPKGTKRSVLVFFHGGGFYSASGQSFVFGPQYLMDQDIVLVTVNYRLAAFGWMSTGDHRAPGNLGMKDQVLALKFVRDSIAAFGGDPNSITISGSSAGAWSTVLHIVSPMSKGLFHRAIVMSGSPTMPDLLPTQQLHLAKLQATLLNCTTQNLDLMMTCMKEKSAEEFASTKLKYHAFVGLSILLWYPVVEPKIPGIERFLPDQPENIIRKKQFNEVPVIAGVTKDEFANIITIPIQAIKKGLINESVFFGQLNQNWETIAPISLEYQRGTERSKNISRELKSFYFKNKPISMANIEALGWLYADAIIGYPVNRFAKLMAENSCKPVYYYEFTYQGRYSLAVWEDTKKPFGVVHTDDLQYIFYMSAHFPYLEPNAPEIPTVEKMTSMWAHFAKTGTPIPNNNPYLKNVVWDRLTPSNNKYLEINKELTMKSNLFADRYSTWDRIFPFNIIVN